MISFPGSKINLGLRVIEKLDTGYHKLESIFIPTTFSDILEIIPTEEETTFNYSGISIPGNEEDNLIYKAWKLLSTHYPLPSFNAYLHKVIPLGTGLGGGSADGSAMLKLLNQSFSLGIPSKELAEMSTKLGADCPFFIENNAAYVEGIGEILSPVSIDLIDIHVLIICPDIHVSTSEAFSKIAPHKREISLPEIIATYPIDQWMDHIFNDFEEYAFSKHPELKEIKSTLYDMGALYASMSGTGSAVYGFFNTPPDPSQEGRLATDINDRFSNYFYHWEKR